MKKSEKLQIFKFETAFPSSWIDFDTVFAALSTLKKVRIFFPYKCSFLHRFHQSEKYVRAIFSLISWRWEGNQKTCWDIHLYTVQKLRLSLTEPWRQQKFDETSPSWFDVHLLIPTYYSNCEVFYKFLWPSQNFMKIVPKFHRKYLNNFSFDHSRSVFIWSTRLQRVKFSHVLRP